ncbi:MAG: hypothetical protein HC875_34805 [Anaerolineales bacterium]|nr:hypothetical protein [Anaerolineales bacterium]
MGVGLTKLQVFGNYTGVIASEAKQSPVNILFSIAEITGEDQWAVRAKTGSKENFRYFSPDVGLLPPDASRKSGGKDVDLAIHAELTHAMWEILILAYFFKALSVRSVRSASYFSSFVKSATISALFIPAKI